MNSSEQPELIKYWSMLRRRWFPAVLTLAAVIGLSIFLVKDKPTIFRANGQLKFNEEESTSQLLGLESTIASGGRVRPQQVLETEVRVMLTTPILEQVIRLTQENDAALNVEELRRGLSLRPIDSTSIVQLAFDSEHPQFAEAVVKQLMDVYVNHNLKTQRASSVATRKYIASQLPALKQQVFNEEFALRKFKERYNISDLASAKQFVADRQTQVQEQLNATEVQLSDLNAKFADLQQKLNLNTQQALAVSALSQSAAVQATLARIETAKRELAEARANLNSDHPVIIDLEARQAQLQSLLQSQVTKINGTGASSLPRLTVGSTQQELFDRLISLEVDRQGLLNRQGTLTNQNNFFVEQATALPRLEQELRELERNVRAADATYQALLKSLQDIKITENKITPTVEVIEPALLQETPVGPNRFATIVRGTLAGLLLAATVVYLLETLDRKLRTVESIRDVYPYTLLGTIPKFDSTGLELMKLTSVDELGGSIVKESYMLLQANLKFLSSDTPVKTMVITSALPGEGKSTTCAHLAIALSQMNHKVLLIDADMRRSRQHQLWELPNSLGLTHLLTDQADNHPTDHNQNRSFPVYQITECLDVLTSGVHPPNPLSLLDSKRMSDFIREQAQHYDYVLIDSPPIMAAADPLVLGKMADGILLVAQPQDLEKGAAKVTKEKLEQAEVNVLGLVINGIIPDHGSHNYYYYSHYYRSGDELSQANSNPGSWIKTLQSMNSSSQK